MPLLVKAFVFDPLLDDGWIRQYVFENQRTNKHQNRSLVVRVTGFEFYLDIQQDGFPGKIFLPHDYQYEMHD